MRESAAKRGYGPKWQAAREEFLAENPWCALCAKRGVRTRATLVNHKIPHRGDRKLFWRRSNWESSCKPCHDGPIQSFERTGVMRGCNEDGIPLDEGHHWNG